MKRLPLVLLIVALGAGTSLAGGGKNKIRHRGADISGKSKGSNHTYVGDRSCGTAKQAHSGR